MRTLFVISVASLTLAACGAKANDPTPNVNAMVAAQADPMTRPVGTDSAVGVMPASTATFVPTAAVSDLYETTAGKIAVSKASDAKVKSFARQMIVAHAATTRALKTALAKDSVSIAPPTSLDAKHQALIDALNAAPTSSFDKLYLAQQGDAHRDALALMQAYAASGDKPAIKSFAADTAPKVQSHIDMLKTLG